MNSERFLPAREWRPYPGEGPSGALTEDANDLVTAWGFCPTATELIHCLVGLPVTWDRGALEVQPYWYQKEAEVVAGHAVVWGCYAKATDHGGALGAPTGTGGALITSFVPTWHQLVVADAAAFTPQGTPTAGQVVQLVVYRSPGHEADTWAGTPWLIGVRLRWTEA